jgi:hypothetical protein
MVVSPPGWPHLALIASRMRVAKRPRTLWASTPILTLPLLVRCDQLLGLKSQSLVFTTYYVARALNINLRWLDRIAASRLTSLFISNAHARPHELIFRWALFRIGINPQELERLDRAGKRVYTYAYGADVRIRDTTLALGRYNICRECPEPGKFCICDQGEAVRNITNIRAHSTAMVAWGIW